MPDPMTQANEDEAKRPEATTSATKPDESKPAVPYYTPQGRTDEEEPEEERTEDSPLDGVHDRLDT